MLKLELDWAADEMPELGDDGEGVTVEAGQAVGPAGWPTVVVFAAGKSGSESGPRLWSWLVNVYGCDADDASSLCDTAVSV